MKIDTVKHAGLGQDGMVLVNGKFRVPMGDMRNRHARKVQEWLDAGNTIAPAYTPEKQAQIDLNIEKAEARKVLKQTEEEAMAALEDNKQLPSDLKARRKAARDKLKETGS